MNIRPPPMQVEPEVKRWLRDLAGKAAVILTGSGLPAASLGSDGDFYLDTSTGLLHVKQSGAWS